MAIYLRVSTVKQLKGYGLEVQLDECKAWLDYKVGKGKCTFEVYTDGGVSGKLAQRHDLNALNSEISAGRFDLVVFGKLDRIGRTMKDIHRWVYDTTDQNVRVATADGRIDSDDEMFGIQLSLLAYMAELEHAMILDRTMGGREKKLSVGGWPGGVLPFWLEPAGKGSTEPPTLREEGVRLLQAAARLITDERRSAEEAARGLNALGFTTARGLPWAGANLIRTFSQTALDGYIIYRNTEHPRGSAVRRGPDGRPLYGETVRIPVPIPLPPEGVEQVRRALMCRSFIKAAEKGYLLTGRVHGPCGHHHVGTYRDLGDPEKLRRLAEEWLGDVPNAVEAYRERIADLDAKIEETLRMRKKKLVALAAVVAADEGDDLATEADLQAPIAEVKEEIREKEQHLCLMRDDAMEGLLEARQQEDRAKEVLELALRMRPQLDNLPLDKKCELLDLLDVRVEVTSDVPGNLRNRGCPFEAWFSDNQRLVPPPLTDEQWSGIEIHFPRPKKKSRVVPPRVAFEASLHKVRQGLQWKDLPESVTQGQSPRAIYQRALAYLKTGAWGRAVRALGDYAGTSVPPLYKLPDLHITGTFDPRLCTPPEPLGNEPGTEGAGDQTTRGGTAARFSSCSPPIRACSTATTARSCGRCNGPRATAG
ncbi:recombinase family protein [Streptomyces sp. NPDC101150]|uniref:recombinase family protein n=1 Tax=Streptomyces sp. NPDC101150 TaxID=3366114 RepID=UPI0038268DC8